MPRYVALLRGVSPLNLRMPALAQSVEAAGFANVRTLLSSGNVAFDAVRRRSTQAIERELEAAMRAVVGRDFLTLVRAQRDLHALVASDPYAAFPPLAGAKRIVVFLRDPAPDDVALPLVHADARLLAVRGREAFGDYVPGPRGGAFMAVLEKALGKRITTRTWDTVAKCAAA